MWLGSQDLGYWLDHALGVSCRFESFNSGDDVPSGGRKFVHHFETQGSPIMIGGGELACVSGRFNALRRGWRTCWRALARRFTLLGVDFNDQTGEIRYLIMDPHYTGADVLTQIQPKWVGWKSADSLTHLGTKLFKADTFYTFCLPQRPCSV
jgi:hypothetical protein